MSELKGGFGKKLREYFFVTIAGMLNAVSLYAFVNPSNLVAGGFSGLSSVIAHVIVAIDPAASFDSLMSIVYFCLNVPLLIVSLILLRGDFTFKTIWATVVCTITLDVLPQIFPGLRFDDSALIAVIFGGVIIGLSMYIAAVNNGSNAGTEVIAKVVSKYHPEIDLSKVILIANLCITIMGSVVVMLVVPNASFVVVLYSLTYVILGGTMMGIFTRGFDHPQKFIIVTTQYDLLAEIILNKFGRGLTLLDVEPTEGQPVRKALLVVVQYRQAAHLKEILKKYDPDAFTFIKDVHDVFSRPSFNRSYKIK